MLLAVYVRQNRRLQATGFGIEVELIGDEVVQSVTSSEDAGDSGGQSVTETLAARVATRVERFDRRGTEPFEPFEFFQNRNFP